MKVGQWYGKPDQHAAVIIQSWNLEAILVVAMVEISRCNKNIHAMRYTNVHPLPARFASLQAEIYRISGISFIELACCWRGYT